MKRFSILSLALALAACGGGEPPAAEAPPAEAAAPAPTASEMSRPAWFMLDEAGRSVHLMIEAGPPPWNFNGGMNGNMTITVPVGYSVTLELTNNDTAMPHSIGVSAQTSGFAAMPDPTPVFPGAITADPASMTAATLPGETESITFTAATAGNYALLCYIPGHATAGMYVLFNVSADGQAGVTGAM